MQWLHLIAGTTDPTLFDKPSATTTVLNVAGFLIVPLAVIVGLAFFIRSLRRQS